MDRELVVRKTADFVRQKLGGEGTGHDMWHAQRVHETAVSIAKGEKGADLYVVQLASLLHDIADHKFTKDDKAGQRMAEAFLKKQGVDDKTVAHVSYIINNISFSGAAEKPKLKTKEAMIVQDADRLDAMGAIGIARAFAYGGYKGRTLHNPVKPSDYGSFADYKKANALDATTINHFYEKLLLLKGKMNTETGRKIAADRHTFMEDYLDQFYAEWDGRK